MTKVEQKYISIGCNRTSNTADINDEGLMAFGGGRYVCLWNPNDENRKGIYSTLIGHESDVSIVKFIQKGYGSSGILSGDSKGQSIIWRRQSNGHYAIGCKLESHQRSISAIGTLKAPKVNDQSDELVVTGGSDSIAKVFKINDKNESKLCQTIDLNNKFPLDITLSYLPQSQTPIMALTLTNNRIEIYIWNESEESFYKTLSLEGHEDWVRSLSFATLPTAIIDGKLEPETVLLASGSQDGYIRLWAIKPNSIDKQNGPKVDEVKPSSNTLNASLLDEFERKLQEGDGGAMDSKSLSTKVHIINDKNTSKEYKLNFEALLLGHDSWVTGLHWHPPQFEKDLKSFTQPQYLLSASADKSMILWSPQSGLWTNERRFGEFGTGGLGFFGGLWSPDGQHVFAHGLNGSVHRWKKDNQSGLWNPELAITGHGGPVKDVEWDPCYEYFLSASIDQTTRLHGPWIRSGIESWHELCRPQSHGYDMQSLTFIGKDQFKFASAADEKIVRLFDAPRGWIKTAKGLGVTKSQVNEIDRPLGASLPPMSLSNRVLKDNDEENVQSTNEGEGKDWTSSNFYGENLQQAPVEEQLVTTLWPESNKLFGHGYELFSASSAHHSSLIATACKAQTPKHAVIRVTDANKATSFGEPLEGHTLTVTNIDWSPDDKLILSVSRDRTWRLFEREQNGFKPIAADKSHARIIWDCSFSTDGNVFGTASRDKTVRIWHRDNELSNEKWSAKSVLKFDEAATAISFSQIDKMLAVGLENGRIEIFKTQDYIEWTNVITLTDIHIDHINKLRWRNNQLLSCSEDKKINLMEFV